LPNRVTFGPFSFDRDTRELWRDDEIVHVPPRSAALLGCLVARPGRLVTKQEIIDEVWSGRIVMDHSLVEALATLRVILEDEARAPRYVETVARRGYRFIAEVAPAAGAPAETASQSAGVRLPQPHPNRGSASATRLATAVAMALLIAAASSNSHVASSGQRDPRATIRVAITLEETHPLDISQEFTVRLSPNGESMIYRSATAEPGQPSLYRRRLDQHRAEPVLGSAGALQPEMSPNGERIVAFAPDGSDGAVNWRYRLITLPVAGGAAAPLTLTGVPMGADWVDGRTLIYADVAATGEPGPERRQVNGLYRISLNGGDPEQLAAPDPDRGEYLYVWPHVLPGGRFVAFTIIPDISDPAPEDSKIALLDLQSGDTTIIVEAGAFGRAAPGGQIVFARTGQLLAVDLAPEPEIVVGEPRLVLDDVVTYGVDAAASFDVSDRGHLVFVKGPAPATHARLALARPDSDAVEWIDSPPASHIGPIAFSPDGRFLVWGRWSMDSWQVTLDVLDRVSGARTSHEQPGMVAGLVFSDDGERVAFGASKDADGGWGVRELTLDGRPTAQHLAFAGPVIAAQSRTPDGSLILSRWGGPSRYDLWELSPRGEARPLLAAPEPEVCADVSPDGRWLAYATREGADWHVYVRRYPSLAGMLRISAEPASSPRWAADGSGLYYASIAGDRTLIRFSPFDSTRGVPAGPPAVVVDLEWPLEQGAHLCRFAVRNDGSEFLLPLAVKNRPFETTEINLLANWTMSRR